MRSIFSKSLPNGGLGTAPPKPPTVTVAVSEYLTPTMQSMKFVGVSQEDIDQASEAGSVAVPATNDFYSAPNPVMADVKPAASEFGKGEVLPAGWNAPSNNGTPTVLVDGKSLTTPAVFTDKAGNLHHGEK